MVGVGVVRERGDSSLTVATAGPIGVGGMEREGGKCAALGVVAAVEAVKAEGREVEVESGLVRSSCSTAAAVAEPLRLVLGEAGMSASEG